MKKLLGVCAAALFGALAFGTVSANAASLMSPGFATAPVSSAPMAGAPVEQVAWVCGRTRCDWVPGVGRGPIPPYARGWGPPPRRGCYWVSRPPRGFGGPPRWVQVCR